MGETLMFQCCECGAEREYKLEYQSDMPDGWFRVEDRGCIYVACSIACLLRVCNTLAFMASPPASDQIDPPVPSQIEGTRRDDNRSD